MNFHKNKVCHKDYNKIGSQFNAFAFEFSFPPLIRLKINPAMIGKIIILIMSIIIFQISTGTYCPPITFIKKGVTKGDMIVVIAPIVTARARFAFASSDITFEANPLGTHPTRIIPLIFPEESEISE